MIQWGCIADDLTGATDLATNLVSAGFRTRVVFGAEGDGFENSSAAYSGVDAVVIALKSRTAPRHEAVSATLAACRALNKAGAGRLHVKYCSTFDSTSEGNIGPMIDSVLAETGERITIVVPSFPDTGRTVYMGHLFVGEQLLNESPMAHHPLTPMRDSSLLRLLDPQTAGQVEFIPLHVVRTGAARLIQELEGLDHGGDSPVLVVIDALTVEDLRIIAEASSHLRVVTGGSGLAQGLARQEDVGEARSIQVVEGYRAILCGSASQQTREQLRTARGCLPSLKLDLMALSTSFEATVDQITEWACQQWAEDTAAPPVIYSTDSLDDLATQPLSHGEIPSALIERALAAIAQRLVQAGARQLIIAGGETSGSVVSALGIRDLLIGPAIAPGIAWSAGTTNTNVILNLALKSGNFGPADFFTSAWSCLTTPDRTMK